MNTRFIKVVTFFMAIMILIMLPMSAHAEAKKQIVGTEVVLKIAYWLIGAFILAAGGTIIATGDITTDDFIKDMYNQMNESQQNQFMMSALTIFGVYMAGNYVISEAMEGWSVVCIDELVYDGFIDWVYEHFPLAIGNVQTFEFESQFFIDAVGGKVPVSRYNMLQHNDTIGHYAIGGANVLQSQQTFTYNIGHKLDTEGPGELNLRLSTIEDTTYFRLKWELFYNMTLAANGTSSNLSGNKSSPYYWYIYNDNGSLRFCAYAHNGPKTYVSVFSQEWNAAVKSVLDSWAIDAPTGSVDLSLPETIPPNVVDESIDNPDIPNAGGITIPDTKVQELTDILGDIPDTYNPPDVDVPPIIEGWKTPAVIIDKFPFCIPYDVVYFFEMLVAEPVTPKWTVPIKLGDFLDTEVVLDMAQYDDLAGFVRTLTFLLFLIGLMLITRKLIMS